jgi:hypothetical protein
MVLPMSFNRLGGMFQTHGWNIFQVNLDRRNKRALPNLCRGAPPIRAQSFNSTSERRKRQDYRELARDDWRGAWGDYL